jgi:tetratricopeptide (TPR) repeat protein
VALIAELGASDFAAREKAQQSLAQLGLEAFDALHAAQNHDDPEIALRARYLVRSMSVRWFSESDAPETVRLLQGYGDLQEGERRNRMDKLASLEGRQGILPLCRLARFETLDPLAKYAALQIIEAAPPETAEAKAAFIKAVREITGSSKRVAANWLRIYAKTLAEPASALEEWDEATKAEQALVARSQDHSIEIARDLYRYQIELLRKLARDDEAANVTRRMFGLLEKAPDKIPEFVGWLMETKAWPRVLELADKFPPAFETNPQLLYCVAQASQQLGQNEKADEIASRAVALNPENLDEHVRTGYRLEHEHGLVKWAQREFEHVIKLAAADSVTVCKARIYLSELLHDQLRELAAAEALQPMCDQLQKSDAYKETVSRVRNPDVIVARMNYFYACHFLEQEDPEKQKKHLELALCGEEEDADVLIAMYRLKHAGEAFVAKTKEKIAATIKEYRAEVETYVANVQRAGDLGPGSNLELLAHGYNQYAWLVGNTFGDYDEAVQFSHKSLEIRPNYGGFLDTLGRCYYAKGDLANAVKYQSRAAKITSHSGQIRRQLEFFVKEAKERGVTLPPDEPAPTLRGPRSFEFELP